MKANGDLNKAVVAESVGSDQILDLYFKVLPTTGFTERMGERKKLGMRLRT